MPHIGCLGSVVSIPELVITQVFQFSIHMKPSDGMSGIS